MTTGSGAAIEANILYKKMSNGLTIPASETDFYNYTPKRWLFNESYELSRRSVKFNIRGLLDVAIQAVGDGAAKCTRATKFLEGQYNKAFLLEMDNGTEVVAKIPNPNAGPAHYTTASEVATADWLRSVLHIPVPKILSWSSTTMNPVESEYIIMEKAPGVLLSDVWYQLERNEKNAIIQQLVDLQVLLASKSVSAHGCLFYRENIPQNLACSLEEAKDLDPRFTVGPLVHPALWEDGRSNLDVWKGPWYSIPDFAKDMGENERKWVSKYAKPRMNHFQDSDATERPSEMQDLLKKYLALAHHISRCAEGSWLDRSSISHPDIHLGNLFIDSKTNLITGVIDWQGAAFKPLVFQGKIPRMVRHPQALDPGLFVPEKPGNYHDLSPAAKQNADTLHESALCQKYYEVLLAKKHPQLYSAILHNASLQFPLIEPLQIVCGSWKNREMHRLRSCLMLIVDNWSTLGLGLPTCPVAFSQEDVRQHAREEDNIDYVESIMEAFQDEGILPADGRVDPEDYEHLKEVNRVQKARYLSLASNEVDAEIMEKSWPWQDWPERIQSVKT